MGVDTKIQWCHHTFNVWWGCTRVSPGCEHCYAEAWAKRTGLGWGPQAARRLFGDKHWNEPLKWNRDAEKAGEVRRVFCSSMADVFEDRPELEAPRARLWGLIKVTSWLNWMLLTKRPENVVRLLPAEWRDQVPRNVWLGFTAEDQKRYDERIVHVAEWPACSVIFCSLEPLLGPVRIRQAGSRLIDLAIIGGESGHHARPCDLGWVRDLIAECRRYAIAPFVKQLGAEPCVGSDEDGHPDARFLHRITLHPTDRNRAAAFHRFTDKKGGDMSEWPEDLRVREIPTVKENA